MTDAYSPDSQEAKDVKFKTNFGYIVTVTRNARDYF